MTEPTPEPWSFNPLPHGAYDVNGPDGDRLAKVYIQDGLDVAEANARLIAASRVMLKALSAASGYLLNAKIDLETGCPKATAIKTIEGGLAVIRTAIEKATTPKPPHESGPEFKK